MLAPSFFCKGAAVSRGFRRRNFGETSRQVQVAAGCGTMQKFLNSGAEAPSNAYIDYMKMNNVDHAYAETKAVSRTKTRPKWPILLLLLLSMTFGAGGCTGYYGGYASSGPYGPGYAGNGPYGPGYAGYPGSVTVEIGDRPYYTRGAGYYVGRSYYVWVPGHWSRHHRVWIHGHYVLR